jgi:hypothetical protein
LFDPRGQSQDLTIGVGGIFFFCTIDATQINIESGVKEKLRNILHTMLHVVNKISMN